MQRATEDEFDHLILGTLNPYLLSRSFHNLESWNEKVCDGAWGKRAVRWREKRCARTRLRPLGSV